MKICAKFLLLFVFTFYLFSCSDDNNNDFLGTDNYVLSWRIILEDTTYKAVIDNGVIQLTIPEGTDLKDADV